MRDRHLRKPQKVWANRLRGSSGIPPQPGVSASRIPTRRTFEYSPQPSPPARLEAAAYLDQIAEERRCEARAFSVDPDPAVGCGRTDAVGSAPVKAPQTETTGRDLKGYKFLINHLLKRVFTIQTTLLTIFIETQRLLQKPSR
jgi:hypothetical protein